MAYDPDLYTRVHFAKHLIGQHEQDNHAREDHATGAGAKGGAGMGAALSAIGGVGMELRGGNTDLKSLAMQAAKYGVGGALIGGAQGAYRGTGTTSEKDAMERGARSTFLNAIPGGVAAEAAITGMQTAAPKSTDVSNIAEWMKRQN